MFFKSKSIVVVGAGESVENRDNPASAACPAFHRAVQIAAPGAEKVVICTVSTGCGEGVVGSGGRVVVVFHDFEDRFIAVVRSQLVGWLVRSGIKKPLRGGVES